MKQLALFLLSVVLLTVAIPLLCGGYGQEASKGVRFTDVTLQAGIRFKHVNSASGRMYYVETAGAGCAFLDYNNDGKLDIYLVNGATLPGFKPERPITGALYRNNGDGTFMDVTAQAGVAAEGIYGMGVAVGDYDNDGNEDLYITGFQRSVLFHNNGNGTFTDRTTAANVGNLGFWGSSAAFLDYDNDGFLDLFVANYVEFDLKNNIICGEPGMRGYCCPVEYPGVSNVLYHNERNGRFTDVTKKAGIFNPDGKGLGVVAADLNGDSWIDIYVANDGVANFLYYNNGNGTFRETGLFSGVAYNSDGRALAGMGTDVSDYNLDGRPDILVTNFSTEGASLYRNEEDEFVEASVETGLRKPTFFFTGWGTRFFDYDNDGDQDVFIANGHPDDSLELVSTSITHAQPKLLLSNEGGLFTDVSRLSGDSIVKPSVSRGVSFGDFDDDGDIDVLIANNNGAPTLLRNDGGNRNHWIKLRLIGKASNRDGIGAKVTVVAGGLVQSDQLRGGGSYLAAHDPRLHFGLGREDRIDCIEIKWPSGRLQKLSNVKGDQIITVREP